MGTGRKPPKWELWETVSSVFGKKHIQIKHMEVHAYTKSEARAYFKEKVGIGSHGRLPKNLTVERSDKAL